MARTELRFPSGADDCAATLHRPDATGPVPCIVMAAGFSSTRGERLQTYAERFAAAGFAALVFDYRHFGDSGGQPRQLLDIKRQLDDYRAAISFARSTDGVDPDRIGLWGTSFSGGHVVKIASEEGGETGRRGQSSRAPHDRHAIAAVVAQTPFTDGGSAMRVAPLKNVIRGTAYGLADLATAAVGRSPVLVPAVGPPGSFAAITEPGAMESQQRLRSPDSRWRNEVTARVALTIGAYRPASTADRITCPLLVCVATEDETTPAEPAQRLARRAPRGELREYACGHFDIYEEPWFERMVGDEIEFLKRHMLATESPAAPPTMDSE